MELGFSYYVTYIVFVEKLFKVGITEEFQNNLGNHKSKTEEFT